jgi:hypothetical protein
MILENVISKVLNHEFLSSLWIKSKNNETTDWQNLSFNCLWFFKVTKNSLSFANHWKIFFVKTEYLCLIILSIF